MTWMETKSGSAAHYVPHNSTKKYSLCGVQADKYTDETMSKKKCKRCEKIKHRAKNGNHEEYDRHEVM